MHSQMHTFPMPSLPMPCHAQRDMQVLSSPRGPFQFGPTGAQLKPRPEGIYTVKRSEKKKSLRDPGPHLTIFGTTEGRWDGIGHDSMSPRSRISPERSRDPGRGGCNVAHSLASSGRCRIHVWFSSSLKLLSFLLLLLLLLPLLLPLLSGGDHVPPITRLVSIGAAVSSLPCSNASISRYSTFVVCGLVAKFNSRRQNLRRLHSCCHMQGASAARNVAKAPSKLPGEAKAASDLTLDPPFCVSLPF